MPDDIPAILAVADSLAPSSGLTDLQRQEAVQSIEVLRAVSPRFLDAAEQILCVGGETPNAELGSTATQGAKMSTNLLKVCKALWALEDSQRGQGHAWQEAVTGKEGTNG